MTILVLALVGGLIGASFNPHLGGFVFGAALGALAGWVAMLGGRVRTLERRLEVRERRSVEAHEPGSVEAHDRRWVEVREPRSAEAHEQRLAEAHEQRSVEAYERPPAAPAAASRPRGAPDARADGADERRAERSAARSAAEPFVTARTHPGPMELAFDRVKTWFTTGNVPVKVGVVLSLFGVGFLVKEAIDRHWMVIPIELRLVLVALFGVALLALGWRLRHKNRTYALSIQGGGIGVLYLTTYASFAIYALLPSAAAFLLLLLVTVAVGALAVLQDSRALAVLGVAGGFMAPVLTSDAAGNHVVLFGYYAVLNAAIVGIAWFKSWRGLNVLGFLFTFVIGSLWGYTGYRPEHFATTEPFLVLFVAMYAAIPVLFAMRQAPDLRGFVDGTLLFGTPLVGFGLQTRLVGDTEYGLAISALALAAFYAGLAAFVLRRRDPALRVLAEALFALAAVFLTIAVPLALNAHWTSVAWSLEGAAMIWLAVRQQRALALLSGIALQFVAGALHFDNSYSGYRFAAGDTPVLNAPFLGAVLIAAAGWLSGWLADREDAAEGQTGANAPPGSAWIRRDTRAGIASVFLAWATAWWVLAGIAELGRHASGRLEPAVALLFIAATALAAISIASRIRWPRLNAVGLLTLPAIVLGVPLALVAKPHPFADFGWLAWPAILATHALLLRMRERQFPRLRAALHAIAYWVLALLLAIETAWWIDRAADAVWTAPGAIWPASAAMVITAALLLLTLRATATPLWPLGSYPRTYVFGGAGAVLAVLTLATLYGNVTSAADPAPLPYVPLLNPLELASVLVAIVLFAWWRAATALALGGTASTTADTLNSSAAASARSAPGAGAGAGVDAAAPTARAMRLGVALPALFGLFLLTMIVARTVHHWAGVPFELERLARSTQFQASLSIVWGTTAFVAMLLGARRAQRPTWVAGAALMGIVVIKLFLVDLGNTGTVGRVISFLGVGVLLLVVGYFAPVPPRQRLEAKGA